MNFRIRGLEARQFDHLLALSDAELDVESQSLLGMGYAVGRGVPQDNVSAHMWCNLAAAQGDQDAAKSRDDLATQMTPSQIAMAQQLAREWKPKPER
jgi:uncharacterized protein